MLKLLFVFLGLALVEIAWASDQASNWGQLCRSGEAFCDCLFEKIKTAPAEISEDILSFKIPLAQAQRKMKPQSQKWVRESIATCNPGTLPKSKFSWKRPELAAPETRTSCRLEVYYSQGGALKTSSAGATLKGLYPSALGVPECLTLCRRDQESRVKELRPGVALDSRCVHGGKELYSDSQKAGDSVDSNKDQFLTQVSISDLELMQIEKSEKANLGKLYSVVMKVKNGGPNEAGNVELDVTTSSALKVNRIVPEFGAYLKVGENRYKIKASKLNQDQEWRIHLTFEVIGEGTANIIGSVKSDSKDSNGKNNSVQISDAVSK